MTIEFSIQSGIDLSIDLKVDPSVMTEQMAHDVVSFWSGGEEVLDASDGNPFEAVARYAASRLLRFLIDGYSQEGAVMELENQEGWPEKLGISITYYEIPDFEPALFEVEEK